MKHKNLQIKLLSNTSQLISTVSCKAGFVSVFRAHSSEQLLPYQAVLSAQSGSRKMTVEIDGEPYFSDEHNLLGFGERFTADDGTIEEFLTKNNVPEALQENLLLSYGIENHLKAFCYTLTACQERRLRLLAATYNKDKVLVLQEPFDPISGQWRERFAELVSDYATNSKAIVIVTGLSYRPGCWVDNKSVQRIQIGEDFKKTIGFASTSESVKLVQEVRQFFKDDQEAEDFIENMQAKSGAVTRKSIPALADIDKFRNDLIFKVKASSLYKDFNAALDSELSHRLRSKLNFTKIKDSTADLFFQLRNQAERYDLYNKKGAGILSLITLLLIAFMIPSQDSSMVSRNATETVIAKKLNAIPGSVEDLDLLDTELVAKSGAVKQAADYGIPKVEDGRIENKVLISYYPDEVQESILAAYDGKVAAVSIRKGVVQSGAAGSDFYARKDKKPNVTNQQAADFLNLLQYTASTKSEAEEEVTAASDGPLNIPAPGSGVDDSGQPLSPAEVFAKSNPGYIDPESEEVDVQKKRDLIRNKFMDAIQRAADQRNANKAGKS